jgi:phage gp29-like protein
MIESETSVDTPRAPTKEELSKEIARIDRSISDVLFYGGNLKLLINGDDVLRQRGKGVAIYADLQRDPHVASVIRKRKSSVTSREWEVTPSSSDPADVACADLVRGALKRLRFDRLTKSLLDSILKGFAVAELMWDIVDGKMLGMPGGKYTVPVRYKKRNQKRFVFDIQDRIRLLTSSQPLEGEELPDRKFIVHTSGDEDDDSPYGRGIGNAIFWPVFFKRQNISFWLVFNDKFGSPTVRGTYPIGATTDEQNKLRDTLDAVSRTASVIIPEGFDIALLEAVRSTTDSHQRMCDYMDAEISKAVLGETLTTSVGENGGNRALGDVHNEVRLEISKDDADELSYTLNETIVKWICDYNFPGRMPPTVWRNFEEPKDLAKVAETDGKLQNLGWERTDESFVETYGEGFVRSQSTQNPDDPSASLPQFKENAGGFLSKLKSLLSVAEADPVKKQRQFNHDVQHTLALGSDQLSREWVALLGPRVKELQSILDETGDLALFRERLNKMINDTPDDKVVETIARATFASNLAGRLPRK